MNLVLIFFSVIFPHIGESVGPSPDLFVTLSTLPKSVNFLNFFTGFKHALATMLPVLNLLSDLFGTFFDFDWIISVLERTIAFVLTTVLCVEASGDSDVERFSVGNLFVHAE